MTSLLRRPILFYTVNAIVPVLMKDGVIQAIGAIPGRSPLSHRNDGEISDPP